MATEFKRMKQLFDSTAGWAGNNIVLLAGEIGLEDTGSQILGKIGNGVATWSALPYSILPVTGTAAPALQAMYVGSDGVILWSNPAAGWVVERRPAGDPIGDWLVTFPTAAPTPDSQALMTKVLNTNDANKRTAEVELITETTCNVQIEDSTGGSTNFDEPFVLYRVLD